ncbi:MAG: hypothetical protein M0T71_15930 [Actinomycetota bacterium]|nr:hypothetical protein [Actinomycetota bacterium]
MTTTTSRIRWLWDHIGRISGLLLGLLAFAFLVLLASVGWTPAYGIIVVILIGILLIILGGRMRGGGR